MNTYWSWCWVFVSNLDIFPELNARKKKKIATVTNMNLIFDAVAANLFDVSKGALTDIGL